MLTLLLMWKQMLFQPCDKKKQILKINFVSRWNRTIFFAMFARNVIPIY